METIMSDKKIIINGQVVLPERIIPQGYVTIAGGKIIAVGEGLPGDRDGEVIDVRGKYISPGFIDMHTHGAGGHDFMDGSVEAYLGAAETHARHGTTALLPTTLTSTDEALYNTFETYKKAKALNSKGAALLGLHLEGPYFAYNQRGAQDPKYLRNPDPKEYEAFLGASDDIVRWSLAPELEGAPAFGRRLREKGILASVGHSDAIYEEVEEAFRAGFTHMTHLYSCMSTITRRNAYRYAGVLEAAYLLDGMTVEVIADGVHLPGPLLQYVYKFKGPDRTALVTDSMRAAGMPEGEYILGPLDTGQKIVVEDGVAKLLDRSAFAGSVATADRLVRTMISLGKVPLVDAVKMISLTPARILGIDARKGSLEAGKEADLVIFDDDIRVEQVFREGTRIVFNA